MKDNFLISMDIIEMAEDMDISQKGLLFAAICEYAQEGAISEISDVTVKVIFKLFKKQYDQNKAKYEEVCKVRSEAGRKGNEKRWSLSQKSQVRQSIEISETKPEIEKDTVSQKSQMSQMRPYDSDCDSECDCDNNINNNIPADKLPALSEPEVLEPDKPLKPDKQLLPHQELFEYFRERYRRLTGMDYLPQKKDFVLLADLLKKQSYEQIQDKINFLYVGCVQAERGNKVFWFAQDKTAFTIGVLSNRFNEIMPKLTEEQKRLEDNRRREERIKAEIAEKNERLKGIPK